MSSSIKTANQVCECLRNAIVEEIGEHIGGDEGALEAERPVRTPAAVLVGLIARPDGPRVILTQRTAHLKNHAGQISLPGGRMERDDVNAAAAALREAEEEIGLERKDVEILGGLRSYDTITGFRIHPVVGWVDAPVIYRLDPNEVAEVFEVPLTFVLDKRNHRRDSYELGEGRRYFYVLPFEHRRIWGATAGILVNFARVLSGS